VDPVLNALSALWRGTTAAKDLRLIGGLAVRLHVGTTARQTLDIDVVALTAAAREQFLHDLEQSGWAVGISGGWWRAIRPGRPRLIVDIAPHPVIHPRTFETMSLFSPPMHRTIESVDIVVAGADDLAALKLLSMRDQDLVDIMLLAARGLSAERIAAAAEADDIERSLSSGAHAARHALQSGTALEVFEQMMSRPPSADELSAVQAFLSALERHGI
jgi:hypothetical protein